MKDEEEDEIKFFRLLWPQNNRESWKEAESLRKTTDLDQVKSVALSLLYKDVHETQYSPAVVQHPFTNCGVIAFRENGKYTMLNILESEENLRKWREQTASRIKRAESLPFLFMMVNRPYGLTFLKYAMPYLSRKDFSILLADAWIMSENPNSDPNLPTRKLVSMFRQADPAVLMLDKERSALAELDDPVTVYRGINGKGKVNALSWTLDRDKAQWFANRFGEDGTVYEAQIGKENILALFHGRNESEIVLDPKGLMEIQISEEPEQGMTMG